MLGTFFIFKPADPETQGTIPAMPKGSENCQRKQMLTSLGSSETITRLLACCELRCGSVVPTVGLDILVCSPVRWRKKPIKLKAVRYINADMVDARMTDAGE